MQQHIEKIQRTLNTANPFETDFKLKRNHFIDQNIYTPYTHVRGKFYTLRCSANQVTGFYIAQELVLKRLFSVPYTIRTCEINLIFFKVSDFIF